MILSNFQWWRRLRGGRWAKVTRLVLGYRWVKVGPGCVERVDEYWITDPDHWRKISRLAVLEPFCDSLISRMDKQADKTADAEAAAAHWERAYRDARNELAGKAVNAKRALNAIAKHVHKANERWWQNLETGEPLDRNVGEMLMLTVSELAEAMEGHRKGLMDDKLPHRPMFEVELADTVIRILDIAAGLGYDIGGAFVEKMNYNATRKDHTREARLADGGKKY